MKELHFKYKSLSMDIFLIFVFLTIIFVMLFFVPQHYDFSKYLYKANIFKAKDFFKYLIEHNLFFNKYIIKIYIYTVLFLISCILMNMINYFINDKYYLLNKKLLNVFEINKIFKEVTINDIKNRFYPNFEYCINHNETYIKIYKLSNKADDLLINFENQLASKFNSNCIRYDLQPSYTIYKISNYQRDLQITNNEMFNDYKSIKLTKNTIYPIFHTLIAGQTGAGKTILILNLYDVFLKLNATIYTIDPKNSDLYVYAKKKMGENYTTSDTIQAYNFLKAINEEMEERSRVYTDLLEKDENQASMYLKQLKHIILLIDENESLRNSLQLLKSSDDKELKKLFNNFDSLHDIILKKGRQFKVFIYQCSQTSSVTNNFSSSGSRDQFGIKIYLGFNIPSIEFNQMFNFSKSDVLELPLNTYGAGYISLYGSDPKGVNLPLRK